MNLYLIGMAAAATVLIVATYIVLRERLSFTVEEAERQFLRFNVQALSNLLDDRERAFLVVRFGNNHRFRNLHRRRMRVAMRYLQELSAIASVLPESDEVRQLRDSAVRLRLIAIRSYLFPSWSDLTLAAPDLLLLVKDQISLRRQDPTADSVIH